MSTATIPVVAANATTASPFRRTGSAPDPALSAWERGVASASRESLLAAARAKLSRLTSLDDRWDSYRASPTDPIAAMVANGVLVSLVRDDQPTPQIAPLADGGVQVEWLVNGQSLEINVSPSGQVIVLAQDDHGDYTLDEEFEFQRPNLSVIEAARQFLNDLASQVRVRLGTS